MSIYKYSILKEVVECGNFTRAAEKMGYTQSGISHGISSLEEEFGFQILNRSRAGVSLTPNGERVIDSVREIINWNEKLNQIVSSINGVDEGKIRIGTFSSTSIKWVPGILSSFLNDYPNIEFDLIDGNYDEIQSWIIEHKIDCGFINLPANNELLSVTQLREDRLLAVLPKDHPLSKLDKIPIEAIDGEHFIVPGEGLDHEVGRLIKSNNLKMKIRYHAKSDHATLAMVESGFGISILPELMLDDTVKGVIIKEFVEPASRTLAFATQSAEKITPAVKIFEKYVKKYLLE